jgi:hypothetical protein
MSISQADVPLEVARVFVPSPGSSLCRHAYSQLWRSPPSKIFGERGGVLLERIVSQYRNQQPWEAQADRLRRAFLWVAWASHRTTDDGRVSMSGFGSHHYVTPKTGHCTCSARRRAGVPLTVDTCCVHVLAAWLLDKLSDDVLPAPD